MHWLALRFPLLPLEAFDADRQAANKQSEASLVVSAQNKVVAASASCISAGVELGMPASTASLLLNCTQILRDKNKEAVLLTHICDVLYAFTPYIEVYSPNAKHDLAEQGVLLELTRSIRLFKGLDALVKQIYSAIDELGLSFVTALGKNGQTAWLLSYQALDLDTQLNSNYIEEACIDRVSIDQLAEFPDEAAGLKQAGFRTLADVRQQIKSQGAFALQKRWSPAFMAYLKTILGDALFISTVQTENKQTELFPLLERAIPSVVYSPITPFFESIEFEFPVNSVELLYEPISTLLQRLCDHLVSTQQQCSGVTWRFSDIYHNEHFFDVKSERTYRDWQWLYELTLIQLERTGLPFEVDQLALCETLLTPVHFDTLSLDQSTSQTQASNKDTQRLIAKLQARVGENNVFKISVCDEHIPELSFQKTDVNQAVNDKLPQHNPYLERPAWLLNTPLPIGEHQNDLYWHGRIQLIRGPEKIAAHWWDSPVERDYFTAVREDHVRLWVFHDTLKNTWCVQGVF